MSVTVEPVFTRTPAGGKIHAVSPTDPNVTVCGNRVHQIVLVESPVPRRHLCDWCRHRLERGDA
jgi:hypothetical protein